MKKTLVAGITLSIVILGVLRFELAFSFKESESPLIVPDDHSKIQWAVNNASLGETIFVKAGIYSEHVIINNTISLVGENQSTTIIDGGGTGHVLHVAGSNVLIRNFSIRGSGCCLNSGLFLENSQHSIVTQNIIGNNTGSGIRLLNSNSCIITENDVTQNGRGFWFLNSHNNSIHHNNLINNTLQLSNFGSINSWDDGYPSGGNYWSDYAERYPTAQELDESGIWNTPYVIDENNQDNYPLIPEFPSLLMLLLLVMPTLLVVSACRKRTPSLTTRKVNLLGIPTSNMHSTHFETVLP